MIFFNLGKCPIINETEQNETNLFINGMDEVIAKLFTFNFLQLCSIYKLTVVV